MADSANNEQVKYKAVSGRICDYFGFKFAEDGKVYSAENVFCMIATNHSLIMGLTTDRNDCLIDNLICDDK